MAEQTYKALTLAESAANRHIIIISEDLGDDQWKCDD